MWQLCLSPKTLDLQQNNWCTLLILPFWLLLWLLRCLQGSL
jgi:hypothetical protein